MPNCSQLLSGLCSFVWFTAAVFSGLSYGVTPDRVSSPLHAGQSVALRGSVPRQALPQFDRGPVEPALRFGYVRLLTVPTASQQKDLNRLLAEQQDRKSPNYHKWLTPEQWADRFGLSPNDVQKITAWLKGQGFSNIHVAHGRNWIMFSGTAAQVQSAFGTEIHRFSVNGEMHVANATLPKIPSALAGIVTSVRGLDDFFLKPAGQPRVRPNYVGPGYSQTGFTPLIAPGDIATMYDINALYAAGIDGTGQKMAVIGQTDVYLDDLLDFRTAFALPPITSANCTTNVSGVITACNDPLFQYLPVLAGGTDPGTPVGHADLIRADAAIEWAGAVAKNAQIIYVNAPVNVTGGTGGGWDVAWQYAVDNNLAPVISLSYGNCELFYPSITAAETILQQASAQGITFVSASGDEGPAECDFQTTTDPNNLALNGIAVTYPASSAEVTAVGGTSISVADLTTNSSTFWGPTSRSDGGSILSPPSYIPEIAWNDDGEWATFCTSSSATAFCTNNNITDAQSAQAAPNIGMLASGGGVSNCANQNTNVCVSGFPQPTYQSHLVITGQPTVRYVPDVALLASPNFPGYIFCTNDAALGDTGTVSVCAGGIPAALSLSSAPIVGGTSVSTSVFAGMVVLLNQYLAGASSPGLGNINPMLYSLAATPANAVFHPVNSGTNDVYCSGGTPSAQPPANQCPFASGTSGVIGFDSSVFDATTGYNLVTGLGSVNLNNLVAAWDATRTATTLSISPSTASANLNQSVTFTATLTFTSTAPPLGNIFLFNNSSANTFGTVALTAADNGVATFSTTALPVGTNTITASYNGDGLNSPSNASAVTVTVAQPGFTLGAAPASASVSAGNSTSPITVTVNAVGGFSSQVTFSCSGLPAGATCSAINPVAGSGTTMVTISTAANMALPTGATTVTVTGTSGSLTSTTTLSLTVTATNQSFTLTPGNSGTYTVTDGQTATVQIAFAGVNGFNLPLTFTCSEPTTLTPSICTGPSGATSTSPATFMVTTTAPHAALDNPFGKGSRIFYAVLVPGFLGILCTAGSRKRSLRGMRMLGLIMVMGVSTMWLGSCGSSSSSTPPPPTGGTPKGSYTVTINATTGGAVPITGTCTFTLVVQ